MGNNEIKIKAPPDLLRHQQMTFNKRIMSTSAYILCPHYAFKTQTIFSYHLKNLYSQRLGQVYMFLWRKMIESTVDVFSAFLRSLMVRHYSLIILIINMVKTFPHLRVCFSCWCNQNVITRGKPPLHLLSIHFRIFLALIETHHMTARLPRKPEREPEPGPSPRKMIEIKPEPDRRVPSGSGKDLQL